MDVDCFLWMVDKVGEIDGESRRSKRNEERTDVQMGFRDE
jgi:hypothetical protein